MCAAPVNQPPPPPSALQSLALQPHIIPQDGEMRERAESAAAAPLAAVGAVAAVAPIMGGSPSTKLKGPNRVRATSIPILRKILGIIDAQKKGEELLSAFIGHTVALDSTKVRTTTFSKFLLSFCDETEKAVVLAKPDIYADFLAAVDGVNILKDILQECRHFQMFYSCIQKFQTQKKNLNDISVKVDEGENQLNDYLEDTIAESLPSVAMFWGERGSFNDARKYSKDNHKLALWTRIVLHELDLQDIGTLEEALQEEISHLESFKRVLIAEYNLNAQRERIDSSPLCDFLKQVYPKAEPALERFKERKTLFTSVEKILQQYVVCANLLQELTNFKKCKEGIAIIISHLDIALLESALFMDFIPDKENALAGLFLDNINHLGATDAEKRDFSESIRLGNALSSLSFWFDVVLDLQIQRGVVTDQRLQDLLKKYHRQNAVLQRVAIMLEAPIAQRGEEDKILRIEELGQILVKGTKRGSIGPVNPEEELCTYLSTQTTIEVSTTLSRMKVEHTLREATIKALWHVSRNHPNQIIVLRIQGLLNQITAKERSEEVKEMLPTDLKPSDMHEGADLVGVFGIGANGVRSAELNRLLLSALPQKATSWQRAEESDDIRLQNQDDPRYKRLKDLSDRQVKKVSCSLSYYARAIWCLPQDRYREASLAIAKEAATENPPSFRSLVLKHCRDLTFGQKLKVITATTLGGLVHYFLSRAFTTFVNKGIRNKIERGKVSKILEKVLQILTQNLVAPADNNILQNLSQRTSDILLELFPQMASHIWFKERGGKIYSFSPLTPNTNLKKVANFILQIPCRAVSLFFYTASGALFVALDIPFNFLFRKIILHKGKQLLKKLPAALNETLSHRETKFRLTSWLCDKLREVTLKEIDPPDADQNEVENLQISLLYTFLRRLELPIPEAWVKKEAVGEKQRITIDEIYAAFVEKISKDNPDIVRATFQQLVNAAYSVATNLHHMIKKGSLTSISKEAYLLVGLNLIGNLFEEREEVTEDMLLAKTAELKELVRTLAVYKAYDSEKDAEYLSRAMEVASSVADKVVEAIDFSNGNAALLHQLFCNFSQQLLN